MAAKPKAQSYFVAITFIFLSLIFFHHRVSVPQESARVAPTQLSSPSLILNALAHNATLERNVPSPYGYQNYSFIFSPHTKRAFNYETAVCKGAALWDQYQSAFQPNSVWQPGIPFKESDIHNGWSRHDIPNTRIPVFWRDVFRTFEPFKHFGGRYPQVSETKHVELVQDRPFVNKYGDDFDIVEKDAHFHAMYFPSFNAILGLDAVSPQTMVSIRFHNTISQDNIDRRIPPLNRLSDLEWIMYKTFSPRPNALRYLGGDLIRSTPAIEIMTRCWQNRGRQPGPWPGIFFSIEEDEAKALLATPVGLGVAWLLVDRARELGKRRGVSVTLFSPTGGYWCWVWDLGVPKTEDHNKHYQTEW